MAKVQVLMGTRNGAEFLAEQLDSIAWQTEKDWSLLISDDGSQDGTLGVIAGFARKHEVGLQSGPQSGHAANYLSLLRQADRDAPFVALSDQDDIWFPSRLARGIETIENAAKDEPVLYAAASRLVGPAGIPIMRRRKRSPRASFANALVQNVTSGNTIMLNRKAADLAALIQPQILPPFHDWWLYALLSGMGARIVIDANPVLDYRQHRGAVLGAHAGARAHLSRAQLIAKGTWRRWLDQHHAALRSIAPHLAPQHRKRLSRLSASPYPLARPFALARAGAHRQTPVGTVAMGAISVAGLS